MFVDQAIITVRAGHGGPGCIAFRREKAAPKGGPNGGDGGNGGSVVFAADDGLHTLYDFRGIPLWAAKDGEPGYGKQCHGANAPDLVIRLPAGTLILNHRTSELLHDLAPGGTFVVAKGGRGGWGNEHFKSSTNQVPRKSTPGGAGEEFEIRFELKLIADVGFVGMPNAGKSTLLKALTRANPKIGNYPFTTLSPQLGITEIDPARKLVLADIPGLIEGAAQGAGLGHDFLRHIERTRVIVHMLDVAPADESDPAANYKTIRKELSDYSKELADKPELIALNKMDLLPDAAARTKAVKKLCKTLKLKPENVVELSGATGQGTKMLLERLWVMLHPGVTGIEGWKVVDGAVEPVAKG